MDFQYCLSGQCIGIPTDNFDQGRTLLSKEESSSTFEFMFKLSDEECKKYGKPGAIEVSVRIIPILLCFRKYAIHLFLYSGLYKWLLSTL